MRLLALECTKLCSFQEFSGYGNTGAYLIYFVHCLRYTGYIYRFTEIWGVQSHIVENLEIVNAYRYEVSGMIWKNHKSFVVLVRISLI